MTGMRPAIKFFLLIVVLELMLFSHTESLFWRRRRRRRRRYVAPRPPPTTTTPPTTTPPPSCDSSLPIAFFKWANKWHQSFSVQCPQPSSMTQWISFYRNCQQDRVHHFGCRLGPAHYNDSHCRLTPHFLHDATHPLHYRCPDDGFITGVYSHFVKASKDRRVYIRCCKAPGYKHHNCKSTRWTKFGESFRYRTPRNYWLTSVTSAYSSSFGDRKWKFEHCQILKAEWLGKK